MQQNTSSPQITVSIRPSDKVLKLLEDHPELTNSRNNSQRNIPVNQGLKRP